MSDFSNWQHMLSLPLVTIEGDTAKARTDFSRHIGGVQIRDQKFITTLQELFTMNWSARLKAGVFTSDAWGPDTDRNHAYIYDVQKRGDHTHRARASGATRGALASRHKYMKELHTSTKRLLPPCSCGVVEKMVDERGFEPPASSLRTRRSPS